MSEEFNTTENTNDLFLAIKQVAKEMAEAVKLSQKQVTKEVDTEIAKSIIVTNPNNLSQNVQLNITSNHNQTQNNYTEKSISKTKKNNRYDEEDNYYHGNNDSTYSQNKSFYEKEIEHHNSLQHRLELLRNKKIQDEMKKFSTKPQLSKNTKKIIQQKFANEKPIYNRTDDIIKMKNAKLEMLKNVYKEIEYMEELENRSRFNPQGYASKEVVEHFINDQMLWQKNKEEKLLFIRNEIEKLEEEAAKSFYKPTISKMSDDIAKNKINKQKEKEVHNRLFNNHDQLEMKKQIMKLKDVPTFTPIINKKPPVFNKTEVVVRKELRDLNNQNYPNPQRDNRNLTPTPINNKFVKKDVNDSKRKMNNSALEITNEDFFDNPLLAQYRIHVEKNHLQSSPIKEHIKNKTKEVNQFMVSDIENKKEKNKIYDWEYQLENITKYENKIDDTENQMQSLYKINVRDGPSYNKEVENKFVANHKYSNIVKKLK